MSWIAGALAALIHIRPIEVEEPVTHDYPPDPAGTQTGTRPGNGVVWSKLTARIEADGGPV